MFPHTFVNPHLQIPTWRPAALAPAIRVQGQQPSTSPPTPSISMASSSTYLSPPSILPGPYTPTLVTVDSQPPKSTESPIIASKPDAKVETKQLDQLQQRLIQLSLSDNPSPTPPKPATAPTAVTPTIAVTTEATDIDTKEWVEVTMFRFVCPWCAGQVEVQREDVQCGVFRHAQYVTGGLVDPHCNESTMKQLIQNKLVIGCGQPFKLLNSQDGLKRAVRCSWQ